MNQDLKGAKEGGINLEKSTNGDHSYSHPHSQRLQKPGGWRATNLPGGEEVRKIKRTLKDELQGTKEGDMNLKRSTNANHSHLHIPESRPT